MIPSCQPMPTDTNASAVASTLEAKVEKQSVSVTKISG
jgi:hypothetical protein